MTMSTCVQRQNPDRQPRSHDIFELQRTCFRWMWLRNPVFDWRAAGLVECNWRLSRWIQYLCL